MPGKKILVVEDEVELVDMIRMRLEANGYEVIAAYDGEEALKMAQNDNPDLIMLDIMLPGIDGYKVCQTLKKDPRYAKIPIIIFTARAQEEEIKLGREMGADEYIIKPFEPQDLLDKIRKFLPR